MNTFLRIFRHSALILAITAVSALAANREKISIKGSDTLVILVQKWTEVCPQRKNIEFQVTGGGSGTGIAALINGTTDICSASRPMKPKEVKLLKERTGYRGLEVRVARDGLSVYLNEENPVQSLTMDQLRLIFTGKITNWKDIGGKDEPILLYSRENSSGTYEFFKENVLQKEDFDERAQHMAGTAALINAISKDPNGIGYGGAAYASGVKAIAVARDDASPAALPNENSILSGAYPISRFLYFYLAERPSGRTKEFIDWVISKHGQEVVGDVGYYPIAKF